MAFPISIKLEKDLAEVRNRPTDEALLLTIRNFVEANKGKDIEIENKKLFFRVGFWGGKRDFFAAVNKGYFYIEDNKLFFKAFIYRDLIMLILLTLILCQSKVYWFAGLFFLIALIANWISNTIKFRRLLERVTDNSKITTT